MKKIVLLGASGSIGSQTREVIAAHPEAFSLIALSVGDQLAVLTDYLDRHPLAIACVRSSEAARDLQQRYPGTVFLSGDAGLEQLAALPQADLVVNALQGIVGLKPTLAAIAAGHDVALANKESLVAAGDLLMSQAHLKGVALIPVDSEHNAIFQCLQGSRRQDVSRLIITASGGSFRDLTRDQLKDVTPQQALRHPNWTMGAKITIDSATMMNKGFEVLEAHHFFAMPYSRIDTILHRESKLAALVEFADHSMLGYLSVSDMRLHIQYALSYPQRLASAVPPLDLAALGALHFSPMDFQRFPLLKLAYEVGEAGGTLPAVMNGANEQAVELFLQQRIGFLDIETLVQQACAAAPHQAQPELASILESDRWAREYVLAQTRKLV